MSGKDPVPQTQAYEGVRATNPPNLIKAARAPNSNDKKYPQGTLWLNTVTTTAYMLTITAGLVTWIVLGSGTTGAITSITGDSGGAEVPSSGNFNILGTANQITVTGSANTETLSVSSTFVAPGSLTVTSGFTVSAGTTSITGTTNINTTGAAVTSIGTGGTGATKVGNATGNTQVTGSLTASTSLTATLGNITATNGNLVLNTAGNKLLIKATSSATCSAGTFVLAGAATTVVANSAVTAASIILLTTQALGTVTAASTLAVTSQIASTSFTVTPSQSTDTSTVAYLIIN